MCKTRILLSLFAGCLGIFAVARDALCAVDVYFIHGKASSLWNDSDHSKPYRGPLYESVFGVQQKRDSLSGRWNFQDELAKQSATPVRNAVSEIKSPQGDADDPASLGDAAAVGLGSLDAWVNDNAFAAKGVGSGDVRGDVGVTIAPLVANGVAVFVMQFQVPADGPDLTLILTGQYAVDPATKLWIRLCEVNELGQPTAAPLWEERYWPSDHDRTLKYPIKSQHLLKAGKKYVVQGYADANHPWADDTQENATRLQATSVFDLAGTFVVADQTGKNPGVPPQSAGAVLWSPSPPNSSPNPRTVYRP